MWYNQLFLSSLANIRFFLFLIAFPWGTCYYTGVCGYTTESERSDMMKHSRKKAALALVLLLAIVFGCMFAADRIQRGNGTIAVTEG